MVLPQGETVPDYVCGHGGLSFLLAQCGFRVLSTDPSTALAWLRLTALICDLINIFHRPIVGLKGA
jgi:hypothetical protein